MKATVEKEARPATDHAARQEFVSPEVNIFENNHGYVLEAEMPGVNKDGLEITLEGNEITIVGHRQTEAISGEALLRERQELDYRRMFELDPAIDSSKISARMEQGILTLHLPKADKVRPRKIQVTD